MNLTGRLVSVTTKGTAKAQADLRRRGRRFAKNVERGMLKGGLLLLRASQEIVPVDQGPLRASGRVRHSGAGLKTIVRIAYTADYALTVHEDLEAAHGEVFNQKYSREISAKKIQPWNGKVFHKRGPNQQAKFLEQPAREKRREIVKVIIDEARKKIE